MYVVMLQRLLNTFKGCIGYKTEVGRAGEGEGGFGFCFRTVLVQIDFLIPKTQGFAALSERHGFHAQYYGVKSTGSVYVGNGKHQVVEAENVHGNGLKVKTARPTRGRKACRAGLPGGGTIFAFLPRLALRLFLLHSQNTRLLPAAQYL